MENPKVQIDQQLFLDILDYISETERYSYLRDEIIEQLMKKLEAMVNRSLYSRYKRALTDEERETAMQGYIEFRRSNREHREL